MSAAKELGALIVKVRNSVGDSQEAFGERLALEVSRKVEHKDPFSRGTVAAWEGGSRVPSRHHLDAIGDLAGWSEKRRAEVALLAQRAAVQLAQEDEARRTAKEAS